MKQQFASVLLITMSLFGLAAAANAGTHAEVKVNIPYEFVAAGRTLPAGTYTVSRLSDDRLASLSIASREQGSGVLALPNHFENRPTDDTTVTFERVGSTYYLRSIETTEGVYTFLLPHSAVVMAKSAQANGGSASGAH